MKTKKLIRDLIINKLQPGEYETITNPAELNNLYALKVKEEVAEIINSDHKDVMEFVDLLTAVKEWAKVNGFLRMELLEKELEKINEVGTFSNIALNNMNPGNPSNNIYFDEYRNKDICTCYYDKVYSKNMNCPIHGVDRL